MCIVCTIGKFTKAHHIETGEPVAPLFCDNVSDDQTRAAVNKLYEAKHELDKLNVPDSLQREVAELALGATDLLLTGMVNGNGDVNVGMAALVMPIIAHFAQRFVDLDRASDQDERDALSKIFEQLGDLFEDDDAASD